MAYITYAQRREWNLYYHEVILPALQDGSLDDVIEEMHTEIRARREVIRSRMVKASDLVPKSREKGKAQEVKPRPANARRAQRHLRTSA